MAEEYPKLGGLTPGLGVILSGEDCKENSQKAHLVSYCDDIGHQSVERTLEHVLNLPHKSIHSLKGDYIDSNFVCSLLKREVAKYQGDLASSGSCRDGIYIKEEGRGSDVVGIDETSICGDIKIVQHPVLIESLALFSSVRANACVWKGKGMYEAILETSGIQQLGWATVSCPFTDYKGVGDAEDSYAFDGKRVNKWNVLSERYGQTWVVGDVIGCCIDLDDDEISFYRNGVSLGIAFEGVRKLGPGLGYYPAVSLSQGERCDLNFGARPFKYPVEGFLPVQAPPKQNFLVLYLLQCLSRLLGIQDIGMSDSMSVENLRRLKRYVSLEDLFYPIASGICEELFCLIDLRPGDAEYFTWGPLLSFLMRVFGMQPPHNYTHVDKIVDLFLKFSGSQLIFQHIINALSCNCKTASLVLTECPYTGSYPYLALASHLFRHEVLMILWWRSPDFEFFLEGLLSRKGLNKQDLQKLIPSVWWPGSWEDTLCESSMILTTTALSGAVDKIEEMHRELCLLVIQFIPPVTPLQLPGSVFRSFLQNLLLKNRGADRNLPQPGVSCNSVLVSVYTVILHFLSEGLPVRGICGWMNNSDSKSGCDQSFLHRGGAQSFPLGLFLKPDPQRTEISRLGGSYEYLLKCNPVGDRESEIVQWKEGFIDDDEMKVTHSTNQKPCCCANSEVDLVRHLKDPIKCPINGSQSRTGAISVKSGQVEAECNTGSLNDDIGDKPSTSEQSEADCRYRQMRKLNSLPSASSFSSASLREEELLDTMLLLYNLGMAPNFKQAAYYISQQSQSMCLLDETDRQIRERSCTEQLRRLKESRNTYREELLHCVRQCAWYRVSMFSRWKQRGMYGACMWIVQLLLVLSKEDSVFVYIPEFYVEAMVDCFHALRRSDPPFVSSTVFIKQGLSSFVTFVVTHFNDPRISSADLRDLLLQSISVLVQYKDYLAAFETNNAAIQRLPRELLSAFDNRSWIPVTNILLRLCKGSGFGLLKNGETIASSLFQGLLRGTCMHDEELFSAFLNRLFNTLSWTMTEFSVSVQGMQECYQVLDMQHRKCSVIFDLSCNLARVLEFCTHVIPQAFLLGPEMNLRRLIELIVFILNHTISVADADIFDMLVRRQGQSPEKINRTMILLPVVGIILNLMDASAILKKQEQNDLVGVFASMDCPSTVLCGFQYLLEYNWVRFSELYITIFCWLIQRCCRNVFFRLSRACGLGRRVDVYYKKCSTLLDIAERLDRPDDTAKGNVLRGADSSLLRLRKLESFTSNLRSRTDGEKAEVSYGTEQEEECCSICYDCQVDAKFKPCRHGSCYGCITRHLLNSQRCFFCNATVVEVVKM